MAAADPTVVAPEGQSAINFGTWSDPNGDAVSLAASVGAVVQDANGTWSWSFPTSDGPDQSRTVIITATDSTGAVSTATFNMVVTNVAPTVTRNQASVGVDEGQTAVNSGLWSDPGVDDVTLAASAGTVTKNANGTWSWSFAASDGPNQSQTVTITATDSDGSASTTTFSLVVANVAPVINSLTSNHSTFDSASVDGNVTIDGTFSDPGVLDTHTVVVNWGDGTPPQTLSTVDQVGHTFTASHHYDAGGTYTISVTLTDKDGDAATQTTTAVVGGVGLIDGTLYVIATNGKDFVGIDVREGGTVLRVDARFQIGTSACQDNVFTFAYADVHRIVINTGAGNDVVNIHNDVCIDTIILGGDGDDILQGGSATNLLVGGDGNDHLFGGRNANILIGGRGSDQLFGRGRHNLMMGGASGIEHSVGALAAALAEWVSSHSDDVLPAFGPLPDDVGHDHLHDN